MDLLKEAGAPGSTSKHKYKISKKCGNRRKKMTKQVQNKRIINDLLIFSEESSEDESDEYLHVKELERYGRLKNKSSKICSNDMAIPKTILYKNENIEKLLERNCFHNLPTLLGGMNLRDDDSGSDQDDKTYIKAKKKRVRKRKSNNLQDIDNKQVLTSVEVALDANRMRTLNKPVKQKNKNKSNEINSISNKIMQKYTKSRPEIVSFGGEIIQNVNNVSNIDKLGSSIDKDSIRLESKKILNQCDKSMKGNSSSGRQFKNTKSVSRGSNYNKVVFENSKTYSDTTSESSLESDDSEEIGIVDHSEDNKKMLELTSKGYVINSKETPTADILALQKHFFTRVKSKVKAIVPNPVPEKLLISDVSTLSKRAQRKLAYNERNLQNFKKATAPDSNLKENLNTETVLKKSVTRRRPRRTKTVQPIKREEVIEFFEDYLSAENVAEGLQSKIMIEGYLRINSRNPRFAYVANPDVTMRDIELDGVKNRNRALDGDFVVISILESSGAEREKGKVVFIKEYNHPRDCVGNLRLNFENDQPYFVPRDKKMPLMFIPLTECPPSFNFQFTKYADVLYLVKIVSWAHATFVTGTIVETIGSGKFLNNQNKSIMLENRLDAEPYGDEVKEYLPAEDFVIPEKEYLYREDFRNECVFTIDPPSARDLDDALSCKILDNGNYEIGVHISDVTYYLHEDTPLDDRVAGKATTVYLVDETYHMLPKQLCLHCSLLPNSDKLTFSVIWEMNKDGTIVNHRFTRSIMNSCCQLSYDHVTRILEGERSDLREEKFPQIKSPWTLDQVCEIVHRLHEISMIFRKKRFDNGALRINQTKLSFQLDPINHDPIAFYPDEHNESHQLIEEFMLLANRTVAARIVDDFPNLAFLRAHPPPKDKIHSVLDLFQSLGIDLDVATAGDLQTSLAKLTDDDTSGMKSLVLDAHLIKTLSRAKYFCSDGCDDDDSHHYALNIPIYTHFTSPIRRYADVVVHRLLSASLNYSARPTWTPEYVKKTAKKCNDKNQSAKNAGDSSSEVYLMKYIINKSPVVEAAVVMDIYENSMEVIIISMGLTRRIYFDNFSAAAKPKPKINKIKVNDGPHKLSVVWPAGKNYKKEIIQTIEIFSVVKVLLNKTKSLLSISSNVLRPTEE